MPEKNETVKVVVKGRFDSKNHDICLLTDNTGEEYNITQKYCRVSLPFYPEAQTGKVLMAFAKKRNIRSPKGLVSAVLDLIEADTNVRFGRRVNINGSDKSAQTETTF